MRFTKRVKRDLESQRILENNPFTLWFELLSVALNNNAFIPPWAIAALS